MKYHRAVKWFGLEGTSKSSCPAMISDIFQLPQAAQSRVQPDLDSFRDGASTTSLGNHFQCFVSVIVEKFLHYMYSGSSLFQFKTITPCLIAIGTYPHLSYKLSITPLEKRKQGVLG